MPKTAPLSDAEWELMKVLWTSPGLTVTAIGDELVAFSSTDGGKTWSDAITINDVSDSARG